MFCLFIYILYIEILAKTPCERIIRPAFWVSDSREKVELGKSLMVIQPEVPEADRINKVKGMVLLLIVVSIFDH